MPHAPVNGIDLYYERHGTGTPVLFLNGSGSTLAEAAGSEEPQPNSTRPTFGGARKRIWGAPCCSWPTPWLT